MHVIPDVFEVPAPRGSTPAAWLTVLAMAVIVMGATAAIVAVNDVPGEDFQVTAGP